MLPVELMLLEADAVPAVDARLEVLVLALLGSWKARARMGRDASCAAMLATGLVMLRQSYTSTRPLLSPTAACTASSWKVTALTLTLTFKFKLAARSITALGSEEFLEAVSVSTTRPSLPTVTTSRGFRGE